MVDFALIPFWPRSHVLDNLGELAEPEGDWSTASFLYEQSLNLARAQQDPWRCVVLRRRGQVALNQGDLPAAHEALHESLEVARDWVHPAGGLHRSSGTWPVLR